MVMQSSQSSLIAKLGERLKAAHEAHKSDETEHDGFSGLPAGLSGAVAQLVDCKFIQIAPGKSNAGEWMFYAAGVVKSPEEFTDSDGVTHRTFGQRTQISEPMFATPTRSRKTLDEHVQWVYNQLRLLGLNTDEFEFNELEERCAALKEAAPHFNFRTWKGAKNSKADLIKRGTPPDRAEELSKREPMVNHVWDGLCSWEDDGTGAAGVDDSSPPAEELPEVVEEPSPLVKSKASTKTPPKPAAPTKATAQPSVNGGKSAASKKPPTQKAPPKVKEPEPEKDVTDVEQDIDSLVLAADNGDEDAKKVLAAMAEERGITEEQITGADNWQQVVDLFASVGAEEGSEEVIEEEGEVGQTAEDDPYEVGKVKRFKPLGPDKKRVAKAINVEIVAVDADKGVATVKSSENGRLVYKGVKLDLLEE